jgi:hypothetical protein
MAKDPKKNNYNSRKKFKVLTKTLTFSSSGEECRNPTLRECEDETHTPEMGTWESFGTLETSEFHCKGQNTSHWGVLYIIRNLSKCRCRKWVCMGHLGIYSTSYGKKKGPKIKLAI